LVQQAAHERRDEERDKDEKVGEPGPRPQVWVVLAVLDEQPQLHAQGGEDDQDDKELVELQNHAEDCEEGEDRDHAGGGEDLVLGPQLPEPPQVERQRDGTQHVPGCVCARWWRWPARARRRVSPLRCWPLCV